DPQARRAIWDLVRGIRPRGKTVCLTTHLMEEAERLCDRVAIIDHGRVIDIGTPAELVARYCPERTVIVRTDDPTAAGTLEALPAVAGISVDGPWISVRGTGDVVARVIDAIAASRIPVDDVRTEGRTLEDVFLEVTGTSI